MGTVTYMDDFRAQPAPIGPVPSITRTPELALIMALYQAVPHKYRGPALCKVMALAEHCPDCDASQEAGRIAALLSGAE